MAPHPLAGRLKDVIAALTDLYPEHAMMLEVEHRAKVSALLAAQANQFGVGAADQYVTVSTVDATAEVTKLRGEIKALECERDYLYFTIENER